jgi:hypothetical protein
MMNSLSICAAAAPVMSDFVLQAAAPAIYFKLHVQCSFDPRNSHRPVKPMIVILGNAAIHANVRRLVIGLL